MRFTARDVACVLGGRRVLDGVSFDVASGEVLGVIGPNGAGKSTLLGCMHGARKLAQGTVHIDGTDVTRADPRWIARKIAVVPQQCVPRFPYTVRHFVGMARYAHFDRGGDTAEAVARSLREAGAEDLADRTVDELSGGELRRVVLAQALAQEPQLLLLDEPLQQLDVRHQLEVTSLLRAFVSRAGRAAVAVLHDLGMAARCCDSLVLLDRGRVVAAGPPREVLTEERLRAVWGIDAVVRRSDVTGAVEVLPLRPSEGRGAAA